MRLVCFANNWIAWQVLEFLATEPDQIAALVLHPPARRKYGDEILAAIDLPADRIFDGSTLRDPAVVNALGDLEPDIGVSLMFGYILRRPLLDVFPAGAINLHPSYLPYNRGNHANVWSIVEGTPAGVTLHYMDEGVDTGDVIVQQRVDVDPADTGETLYRKLERAAVHLFKQNWSLIRSGSPPRHPQTGTATCHRAGDLERLDRIDLDRTYAARELIDILRARTFPPYAAAHIEVDGRRIQLRLDLDELQANVEYRDHA